MNSVNVWKLREASPTDAPLCRHCQNQILPKEGRGLLSVQNRVFCSRSCANAAHNQAAPKRTRKDRKCILCGGAFKEGHSRRKICPACWAAEAERLNARTKGETSRRNLYFHAAKVMAAIEREPKCQQCGYAKFVDICHIRSVGSFPETALLLEINAPENLTYLCPNCHHEFDAGHFKI